MRENYSAFRCIECGHFQIIKTNKQPLDIYEKKNIDEDLNYTRTRDIIRQYLKWSKYYILRHILQKGE